MPRPTKPVEFEFDLGSTWIVSIFYKMKILRSQVNSLLFDKLRSWIFWVSFLTEKFDVMSFIISGFCFYYNESNFYVCFLEDCFASQL